jgi:hypothetical protein
VVLDLADAQVAILGGTEIKARYALLIVADEGILKPLDHWDVRTRVLTVEETLISNI